MLDYNALCLSPKIHSFKRARDNMEMAVQISNDEPQQLVSSFISSSTPFCAPPANNASSFIPNSPVSPSAAPPPASPKHHQAESQHSSIAIPPPPAAPPISSSRRQPRPYVYPTREVAWRSLHESIPHFTKLGQLKKSEMGYRKEASSHKKQVRRLSKDLYVVVSIYAVLQGALFSAVAQSNHFTCADLWGPVAIISAVTIATLWAARDKLQRMRCERQEVKKFERRQSAVYDKIALLYRLGSLCKFEDLEPAHAEVFNIIEGASACFYSAHGWLVLGFLFGFSGLMLVSCKRMLECAPCRCH